MGTLSPQTAATFGLGADSYLSPVSPEYLVPKPLNRLFRTLQLPFLSVENFFIPLEDPV